MPHPVEASENAKRAPDVVGETGQSFPPFPSNRRLDRLVRAEVDRLRADANTAERLADELRCLSPNSAAFLALMLEGGLRR